MVTNECDKERLSLRLAEAARMLGVSPRTLWSMTRRGEIPHVALMSGKGRKSLLLYPVDGLREWLQARTTGGPANQAGPEAKGTGAERCDA
ncbi:MAG: helix-turn-helix domain-containing protein [Thermogutta sp.]|nr:helix-turn-helix domain-containing protein [Thermogutta sp.]